MSEMRHDLDYTGYIVTLREFAVTLVASLYYFFITRDNASSFTAIAQARLETGERYEGCIRRRVQQRE